MHSTWTRQKKMFSFGEKSTFKNLLLFIKKVHAIFELRTRDQVSRPKLYPLHYRDWHQNWHQSVENPLVWITYGRGLIDLYTIENLKLVKKQKASDDTVDQFKETCVDKWYRVSLYRPPHCSVVMCPDFCGL